MSEETIVRQAAPTLAGLKTGNLFPVSFSSQAEFSAQLCALNRLLVPRGLCAAPLRRDAGETGRALLYLYRPARLARDLQRPQARRLLQQLGYDAYLPGRCLQTLCRRLSARGPFPHEIGLFLGYPPEDVQGFIECGASCCKCTGCWKVYGDVEAAQRLFRRYRRCSELYCRRYLAGTPLQELIVAS